MKKVRHHMSQTPPVHGTEEKEPELSNAIRKLREMHVTFLASPKHPWLQQVALVEDDDLCSAVLRAKENGDDLEQAQQVALKCETDGIAGPTCGIGPKGLAALMHQLGMDCGMITLEELKSQALSQWYITTITGYPAYLCGLKRSMASLRADLGFLSTHTIHT